MKDSLAAKPLILLCAGGTGGHLFPAEALSAALARRGATIDLMTDDRRGAHYSLNFPARAIYRVKAATPTGGSLASKLGAILSLGQGTFAAIKTLRQLKPAVVVGFGGYPTVPPLLAARYCGIKSVLHEQNAVMGRANRFLAKGVQVIASGFPTLGGIGDDLRPKVRFTGNPVRPAVIEAARQPYPETSSGFLRILVTGGSQGARVFSDIVPEAVKLLPKDLQARLILVQQARAEDEERVVAQYKALGVRADVAPFFADLPQKIAQSHLVIARAGASTVSELAFIGRPSVLVPFPHALDQDQAANAKQLAANGSAIILPQPDFTPQRLADELAKVLHNPDTLAQRAAKAKEVGIGDAAERLAAIVMDLVKK